MQDRDCWSRRSKNSVSGSTWASRPGNSRRGEVEGLAFSDEQKLDVDMVIVAAGIRPRDELARAAALHVGERGGVIVDDLSPNFGPASFSPSVKSPSTAT